ncbi:MAG: hypothetical protein LUC45_01245 [Paraprevotella sp.]|nr:hypothetical protein [Paraprevotella sp.]
MTKKILLLVGFVLTLFYTPLAAQPSKEQFSPQNYVRDLESFIVREACLSPAEATAFFPIFHEMHDKQRGIEWQIRNMKKRPLPPQSTDKDYYNLIRDINKLKMESAELEDTYYRKMCKVVSAQKVYAAMRAEDKFHRRMLRQFTNRPPEEEKK